MTSPTIADILDSLAERCEAASGADRELDAATTCVAGPLADPRYVTRARVSENRRGMVVRYFTDGNHGTCVAPDYTASLDAAIQLVPENHEWSVNWAGNSVAEVGALPDGPMFHGHAATPALALTAACLRARATLARAGAA